MATVINSSFKPFSFDEMIKPLLLYKAEYDKVEQDYLKYLSDTDKLRLMATEDPNSRTANQYSTYNNELIAASEEFNKGMTLKNRQTLNNLKRRYSSEIVPISQAIELRQKQIEEQDKMYLADSDRMFSRLARNTSLDAYLDNPNLNYQSVSGKEITAKSAEDFKHLTKTILSQNRAKWQPILGNQYYERALQKGLTFEQAALIAKNDPNAAQEFNKIIDDAVELSHIADWDMSDDDKASMLEKARMYARQGAYAGIGDLSYQQQSNKAYDYAMQEQMAINKEIREAAKEGMKNGENSSPSLYWRPVHKTTVDGTKNTKQMSLDLALIQEILKDPSLLNQQKNRMVQKGRGYVSPTSGLPVMYSENETYYPYQEKLRALSKRYGDISYDFVNGKLTKHNFNDTAKKIAEEIKNSAIRETIYKSNITQSDLISQAISQNIMTYNRKSGKTGLNLIEDDIVKGAISMSDLLKYFNSNSNFDYEVGKNGFIVNTIDTEGNPRSALIDFELIDDANRTFATAHSNIQTALANNEPELATQYINALMTVFHKRFNTLPKRQGNTTSKDE